MFSRPKSLVSTSQSQWQPRIDPLPDNVRVVNIHGADYYIPWEQVPVGASFFLPTTATARQVRAAFRHAAQYLDYHLEVRRRREFGVLGARVWRVL